MSLQCDLKEVLIDSVAMEKDILEIKVSCVCMYNYCDLDT